jgi:hypothetical protein
MAAELTAARRAGAPPKEFWPARDVGAAAAAPGGAPAEASSEAVRRAEGRWIWAQRRDARQRLLAAADDAHTGPSSVALTAAELLRVWALPQDSAAGAAGPALRAALANEALPMRRLAALQLAAVAPLDDAAAAADLTLLLLLQGRSCERPPRPPDPAAWWWTHEPRIRAEKARAAAARVEEEAAERGAADAMLDAGVAAALAGAQGEPFSLLRWLERG